MRIPPAPPPPSSSATVRAASVSSGSSGNSGDGPKVAVPSGHAGHVDVSSKAHDLARASQHSHTRVHALRHAIASGSYQVDAHAVATAIVQGHERS